MLPDKPIMLRWRQSDTSPTGSNASSLPSARSQMSSFTVSMPKAAASSPQKRSPSSAKFVNFTAASPHQKKVSPKSKEKRKPSTSPKSRPKSNSKDKEIQRKKVRTTLDVLEPSKDEGLVAKYPSPLDRYFFSATPFPFTSLETLNTGHYTNFCKLKLVVLSARIPVDSDTRSSRHREYDVSAHRESRL